CRGRGCPRDKLSFLHDMETVAGVDEPAQRERLFHGLLGTSKHGIVVEHHNPARHQPWVEKINTSSMSGVLVAVDVDEGESTQIPWKCRGEHADMENSIRKISAEIFEIDVAVIPDCMRIQVTLVRDAGEGVEQMQHAALPLSHLIEMPGG